MHNSTDNTSAEPVAMGKQWCTREQIAEHFQIGLRTVGNLMRRKVLPYNKTANLVRFERRDCDLAFEEFGIGYKSKPGPDPLNVARTWRTKEQIAAHLQVSLRTMTNLMRRNVLPYVKIGHLVRVDLGQTDLAIEKLRSRCLFDRRDKGGSQRPLDTSPAFSPTGR